MLYMLQYVLLISLSLLLWVTSASYSSDTAGDRVTDSLRLVTVVSRHGNRAGYQDYPLDPYPVNNTEYWPYGAKQLTPRGRAMQYNLGKRLRSLYDGFLPAYFNSDDIYASCDAIERVIMSGKIVLAGLYPPVGSQVWNADVNWQPIALYVNDTDRGEFLDTCPRYLLENETTYREAVEQESADISQIKEYVYQTTGGNLSTLDIFFMYDKLVCEETEGYSLPDWTKQIYPDPLRRVFSKLFYSQYLGNDEIVRLSRGNMLEEILDNMGRKVNGSLVPERKLYYYSGHDDTILALQVALGVADSNLTQVVRVGSALVIELHETADSGNFTVQMVYIEGSSQDSDPEMFYLPMCGEPCEFHTLVNNTERFTGVDYEQECQTFS